MSVNPSIMGGITFKSALRDLLVNLLPVKHLSLRWIKTLYGNDVTFIFLTHPRSSKDIFSTFPLLAKLSRFIPQAILLKLLSFSPCYIAARVRSAEGLTGFFVSTSMLPSDLFNKRDTMLKNVERIVHFIRKITTQKVYVGLAAWWPIVTNGGAAFSRFLDQDNRIVVTNGHSATLASIVLSIEKIAKVCDLPLKRLKLLVIGVGKMGGAVAQSFNGIVEQIGLVDQNDLRLQRFEKYLNQNSNNTKTERIVVSDTTFDNMVAPALARYHVAVCTTSSIGYVIKDLSILQNCIILDDARPEAFPRIVDENRNIAVLEGGLMKIPGITVDSDFGFGCKDNIFGCLAEAFILNRDGLKTLRPTIGDVDFENFKRLLESCKKYGISEGDFKSGPSDLEAQTLKKIIKDKLSILSSSIGT